MAKMNNQPTSLINKNNQLATLATQIKCHNCQQTFYFHTYHCEQWKCYYNKSGQLRPTSDFYQLYCQPPYPNCQDNIYLHCRQCLVFFRHSADTDEEGKQVNGAIYIDKNGLCIECRNKEEHVDHPCLLNPEQRVWGTKESWEGLFTSSNLWKIREEMNWQKLII